MTDKRKDCPMRHENGNCTVAGGFCTAVNNPICEALHNAFDCGYRSALRQQEQAFECTQYEECEYNGNPVCNLPAKEKCPHGLKRNDGKNKPLTLDELRQMDGEPVWVQSPGVPEYGRWAIVEGVGENCLFLHDDFTCHDYGKTWLAYRQKPEEGTV